MLKVIERAFAFKYMYFLSEVVRKKVTIKELIQLTKFNTY